MIELTSKHPHSQIVTCTKNLVDSLLAMNTKNRNSKKGAIEKMKAEMMAGRFWLTASGVGVSKTGVLLDGQNRLMAMREAGYPPVKIILATGLEDGSQVAVDRHSRRTLSDSLTMFMNITVSTSMVALVNALYAFGATNGDGSKFAYRAAAGLVDSDVADYLAEHSELIAEVISASGACRAPVMAAFYVYAVHDRDRAFSFCRDVVKGINLQEDHPAYRLRMSMDRLKRMTDAPGRIELFKTAAAAVIADSRGRTLKMLRPAESWAAAPWKWAMEPIRA